MRERINRLAKGIIDTECPILLIQPSKIEETVRAGEEIRKELYVTSQNSLHIKGLAYSSNTRVSVESSAFGGLRNHVYFHVNSTYLEYGDVIEGVFYLVTNGGEMEIPYSFRVEAGDSGQLLMGLETPKDFADIARDDYEMALRLFEYQDFTEVPFMQVLPVRMVYDGVKGHGNRYAQLEEFLIALEVKQPVRLEVSTQPRVYEDLETLTEDIVEVKKDGWGYLPVSVKADGAFIKLSMKMIAGSDFEEDICRLAFQIEPSRLHGGNNYGAITLSTMTECFVIPVYVKGQSAGGREGQGRAYRFGRLLALRLDYECQSYEPALLRNRMFEEVEQLKMSGGTDDFLLLLEAELYGLSGNQEKASRILSEIRPRIQEIRMEQPDYYCFLQYVTLRAEPEGMDADSFIRLLRKYQDEGTGDYLQFYMLAQLDESLKDNPGELLHTMKEFFQKGCHSPFLYLMAVRLLNERPELLYKMGAFEIQVLYFGARKNIIGETLAQKAAKLGSSAKHDNRLQRNLLGKLYETYPQKEVLEAVCGMMIRGDCRRASDFVWYERALKEKLSLTRLYEYYLYALPKDFNQLIPKEVLLYFSYDHELDRHSKSVLYKNILTYMKSEDPLYKEYERVIEKFATEQIFESRINSRLAVIYDHMIYKDMIDLPVAKILPGILRSYRIRCRNRDMKYAVVCYEELMEEGVYPLVDGTAYAPIYSGHSRILFQDAYGNRYTDVSFTKTSVLEKPELEERCFEVCPNHPMLLLKACGEVMEKETLTQEDILILERALRELKLHPLYKTGLTIRMIGYYQDNQGEEGTSAQGFDDGYLRAVDKQALPGKQRTDICETLINQNYIKEAYEMIREYGCEGISSKRLLKLCTKMILEKLFDQDELLLKLSYQVFTDGISDSVILDYLCEFFNGTCEQMYRVLKRSVHEHVETYDLEERLLAQMMFAEHTDCMDQVFTMYMARKKTSESIVKAYFTMKSTEYFFKEVPADDQVFVYLEGVVNGAIEKDKLPAIYLLALTKYYASLPTLLEEQRLLCQEAVDILLGEGMVFAHFKKLAAHVTIPEDILNKGIIQYMGRKDSRVDLQIRILPDEERYHSDDMKRIYQGVFVKQKVLFEGEVLEYRIYEFKDGESILMEEGKVTCDYPSSEAQESRFGCLNRMSLCLSLKEEEGLKKTMREYLMKTAAVEELFEPM